MSNSLWLHLSSAHQALLSMRFVQARILAWVTISFFSLFLNNIPLYMQQKWQPTSVFLSGESHGKRNLVGKVHGVAKSQTWLSNSHFHFQAIEGHFGCFRFSSIMNKVVRRSKKSSKRIQIKEIASRILWHSGCRTWEKQESHVRCQFFLSHWKNGLPTYWNREGCGIWLGKIKFKNIIWAKPIQYCKVKNKIKLKKKNIIWELVDLDCYLDIHLDMPSWQLVT